MATAKLKRPMPPEDMHFGNVYFAPAAGVDEFVRASFLAESSKLFIGEHAVLKDARFGYLWAFPPAKNRDRVVLGTAQAILPAQSKWSSLRAHDQVYRWFGQIDF